MRATLQKKGSTSTPTLRRAASPALRSSNPARLSTTCTPRSRSSVAAAWRAQDAAELVDEASSSLMPPETFYDLLNVPPTASRRRIRQAYLDVIKECHPDRSNQEAHEFCVLLNEIYETLSDPQRRAAYDAITGLAEDSINPFTDDTHERDQVFVDEVACIGCRNCANVCPASYKIEDFHGRARVVRQGADTVEKLQESMDICPVSCIHWVTAPQLAMLEQTMARMDRVAVWSMFMGSGSAKNVFLEASLAWEKRLSDARRMRAAAAAPAPDAAPWSKWFSGMASFTEQGAMGSRFYENVHKARNRQWGASASASASEESAGSSDEDWTGADNTSASGQGDGQHAGAPLSEKQARNIATLAARAARASRTWRTCQEVSQRLRSRPLQLAAVSLRAGEGAAGQASSSSSSMSDS